MKPDRAAQGCRLYRSGEEGDTNKRSGKAAEAWYNETAAFFLYLDGRYLESRK